MPNKARKMKAYELLVWEKGYQGPHAEQFSVRAPTKKQAIKKLRKKKGHKYRVVGLWD